jgi:hypothetical protein
VGYWAGRWIDVAGKTLTGIPVERAERYQQRALMRLQLKLTGDVHQLLLDLASDLRARVLEAADDEGGLPFEKLFGLQTHAGERWQVFFDEFVRVFGRARWQAAALPFATLLRRHNWYARQAKDVLEETTPAATEASGVFNEQIESVLRAARERVYGDGFNLSNRLWRLDRDSLRGIQDTLYCGIAGQKSAWDIAKDVEGYLGPGADCPRWTRYRLYGKTKQQIAAGDTGGLYRGDECAGQGVAYNALRLARNEIQIAHHLATDAAFARQPWIEKEQVLLSPDHPDIGCACEDVVAGGENGDGAYPKGEVTLPIHVQCLCYKVAMLMEPEAFTARVREWMRGEATWPAMDEYAAWLGTPAVAVQGVPASPMDVIVAVSIADLLVQWVWGGEEALASMW